MENKKKGFKQKLGEIMKNYLVMGIAVVIPVWLTYFVVSIVFTWVSNFTFPSIYAAANVFISNKEYSVIIVKIVSFFLSIVLLCLLGFAANIFLGKSIIKFLEKLIEKIPILSTVYFSTKQFVNFIFSGDKKKGFKQVVIVPYPTDRSSAVAFLTNKIQVNGKDYVCVFMPTTPNPSTGFLMLFDEKDVVYTDYTIDQAFQFIISVGVINLNDTRKSHNVRNEDIKELKKHVEKLIKEETKKSDKEKADAATKEEIKNDD
ncbi:MAG: DUF502 domain-containing protein [Elusimicrobiota bacterium]|jgi:uncharacterized membrane protein|nr:DUF502 domain-containing protein [Elusimicrobiota bacterium]